MSNIDFSKIPKIEYPRMAIYLIYANQLEGLMTGRAKITNLPEGAKIYKVVPWMPDQCDNAIAVWMTHPSFTEVPYGNLVETKYLHWEETINIGTIPVVQSTEYWPDGGEDVYFNKE